MAQREPNPLVWIGSSRQDLAKFPAHVRYHMGFALYQAQIGLKHRDAKPLSGMGSGVLELLSRFDKDTYRAVYTVQFSDVIYVLHAFQKKSKRGIATPRHEELLIRQRLRTAQMHHLQTYGSERR